MGLGSSPLARGLLRLGRPLRTRTRIIPARAGFTAPPERRGEERGDHPRSRGVYVAFRFVASRASGSSPLARGLPTTCGIEDADRRIIPARAGFTRRSRFPLFLGGDHPRSRGVYFALLSACRPHPWIIPARAGFTVHVGAGTIPRGDHPRSRGVYAQPRQMGSTFFGSSPLARGLRMTRSPITTKVGIIPARAGFTPAWLTRSRRAGDHPRSRGVYR